MSKRDRTPKNKRKDLDTQEDPWQENMHMSNATSETTDGLKLAMHGRLVGPHDKFVEYIRHIESKLHDIYSISFIFLDAKRLKVKSQIEEMMALDNAGMRTNQRFIELSYMVNEYEEEEE